jgi:DNA (cytosine-5)-methyltransferase 1
VTAYFNENDPAAAAALRALIKDGVIAPGDVDERSICDVRPEDLRGYKQAHFFAGGGLWSVAARIAGWPDECELWTGSCPCQSFSDAGKRRGTEDARHLWPEFYRLIRAVKPGCVMGEQTSAPLGLQWFDEVSADMEREGYAIRAADISALAVGASQIRQRLWFVACADGFTPPRAPEPRSKLFHWSSEPEMGCLAYEVPGRMDFLRIAGNAIVPTLAAEVISALMECYF